MDKKQDSGKEYWLVIYCVEREILYTKIFPSYEDAANWVNYDLKALVEYEGYDWEADAGSEWDCINIENGDRNAWANFSDNCDWFIEDITENIRRLNSDEPITNNSK